MLYHYTNELCFHNIGNLDQMAAELFASLEDGRAHFGKGIYASQHEPAVWGTRLRILMNNYSNSNPLSFDAAGPEPQRVAREWGHENPQGHRAAFCIPLIVPKNTAYFIFERQTPDMAMRRVPGHSKPSLVARLVATSVFFCFLVVFGLLRASRLYPPAMGIPPPCPLQEGSEPKP